MDTSEDEDIGLADAEEEVALDRANDAPQAGLLVK